MITKYSYPENGDKIHGAGNEERIKLSTGTLTVKAPYQTTCTE